MFIPLTPENLWFPEFTEPKRGLVLLGDKKPCKITKIGTIRCDMHDGIERVLEEVRFVPCLKRNLISFSEFEKNECV